MMRRNLLLIPMNLFSYRIALYCCPLFTMTLGHMAGAQEGPEPSKQPTPSDAGKAIVAQELEKTRERLKKVGEQEYELGEIKFNSTTREIRVPCKVNMTEGLLEYVVVHEHGKTHESLLSTSISPLELNVAMLLTNYEPHIKEAAQYLKEPRPMTTHLMSLPMERPGANQIEVAVEWKDAAGGTQTAPVTRWIKEKNSTVSREKTHWTYTGSMVSQTGFAAQFDGSIMAIYFDLIALINFPVKENNDDDRWEVATAVVPPIDTPVTLVITPKAQPKQSAAP
jgi:hypothetical protein